MTVPILNPIGLHSQLFEASVQAARRGAAAVVLADVPVIGLSPREAHAVNDATKSASIDTMRVVFIIRSRVPCPYTGSPCIMKPVSAGRTRGEIGASGRNLVPPAGFEPTAPGLGSPRVK